MLGFRYIGTAGLAGIVCNRERKTIKLLVGRGSCIEAETKIVRFWNHRDFSPVRMSNQASVLAAKALLYTKRTQPKVLRNRDSCSGVG